VDDKPNNEQNNEQADDQAARRRAVREQIMERARTADGRIDPAAARIRDGFSPPVNGADREPPDEERTSRRERNQRGDTDGSRH
jgi:hypothetical protein